MQEINVRNSNSSAARIGYDLLAILDLAQSQIGKMEEASSNLKRINNLLYSDHVFDQLSTEQLLALKDTELSREKNAQSYHLGLLRIAQNSERFMKAVQDEIEKRNRSLNKDMEIKAEDVIKNEKKEKILKYLEDDLDLLED